MQRTLREEVGAEETFGLTQEYIKKIRETWKEKDIYDEEFQQDSFASLKKKLVELDAKLKEDPRVVGRLTRPALGQGNPAADQGHRLLAEFALFQEQARQGQVLAAADGHFADREADQAECLIAQETRRGGWRNERRTELLAEFDLVEELSENRQLVAFDVVVALVAPETEIIHGEGDGVLSELLVVGGVRLDVA